MGHKYEIPKKDFTTKSFKPDTIENEILEISHDITFRMLHTVCVHGVHYMGGTTYTKNKDELLFKVIKENLDYEVI